MVEPGQALSADDSGFRDASSSSTGSGTILDESDFLEVEAILGKVDSRLF